MIWLTVFRDIKLISCFGLDNGIRSRNSEKKHVNSFDNNCVGHERQSTRDRRRYLHHDKHKRGKKLNI